jgi:hypothetical protein
MPINVFTSGELVLDFSFLTSSNMAKKKMISLETFARISTLLIVHLPIFLIQGPLECQDQMDEIISCTSYVAFCTRPIARALSNTNY